MLYRLSYMGLKSCFQPVPLPKLSIPQKRAVDSLRMYERHSITCLSRSWQVKLQMEKIAWKVKGITLNKWTVHIDSSSKACLQKTFHITLERVMGIEPTSSAWKAEVLPLNYTRDLEPRSQMLETRSLLFRQRTAP